MAEDWIKKNQDKLTEEQKQIFNSKESTIKYYTFAGFLVGIIPHMYILSNPITIQPHHLSFKGIIGVLAFSQIPILSAVLFSFDLRQEQKKFMKDLEEKMKYSKTHLN